MMLPVTPDAWGLVLAALLAATGADVAQDAPEFGPGSYDTPMPSAPTHPDGTPRIEALVPEVAANPYRVSDDPARFLKRINITPAVGWLGSGRIYLLRLGYDPNTWLGYEIAIGHIPGASVHALTHMLSVQLRPPLPGRIQPYGTLGYGMTHVFPGALVNADPVTENTLAAGAGLEFYIRDDVSFRSEARHVVILGDSPDRTGSVAYRYGEFTFGFAFHRRLGGHDPSPSTSAHAGGTN